MEIRLVHLLSSRFHKHKAFVASILSLHLLRDFLDYFSGWNLRYFHYYWLVSSHYVGIIHHFRKIALVIIFFSFQQRLIDPLNDTHIWLLLFINLSTLCLLRFLSKVGLFWRNSLIRLLFFLRNSCRSILLLTKVWSLNDRLELRSLDFCFVAVARLRLAERRSHMRIDSLGTPERAFLSSYCFIISS